MPRAPIVQIVVVFALLLLGASSVNAETSDTSGPSEAEPDRGNVNEADSTDLDAKSTSLDVVAGPNGDKAVAGAEQQIRRGGRNSRSVPSDLDCTRTKAISNDLVEPAYGRLGDYALDEETNRVRENISLFPGEKQVEVDSKGRIDAETVVDVLEVRPSDERLYSPTGQWDYLSCIRDDGSLVFNLLPVGGPAVSLYDLLYQGLTEIDPPVHEYTINPAGKQVVQFRTLFWIDPAYWDADRSTTVGNGNVSLSLALVPFETEWDPGDGSEPVVCDGPGEVWETGLKGETFYCKHTYRTVKGQPFTVTSTLRFELQWETNSSEVLGPFAPLTRVDTVEVGAREIQVVETSG